jgi:DNA transformation protein and related proteins
MKSNSFKEFILEQLAGLDSVTCRSMFGGFGLYYKGKFFGVIDNDRVFFKTDQQTRKKYIDFGMNPFAPTPEQVLKNYYEVPGEIIENAVNLAEWAIEASNR